MYQFTGIFFRSIIRLSLLFSRKEFIVEPNPISPLNRKNIEAIFEETPSFINDSGIILPNGRIIRNIDKGTFKILLKIGNKLNFRSFL